MALPTYPRIYSKWTCPNCGKKIGANNFKRHLRACEKRTTTHQDALCQHEDGNEYIQQSLIDSTATSDCTKVAEDTIEILAFDLASFEISDTGACLTLVKKDGASTWLYNVPINDTFVSYANCKVYVPTSNMLNFVSIRSEYEKNYGLFKPIFGDIYYGRCTITKDRWENREKTRKYV